MKKFSIVFAILVILCSTVGAVVTQRIYLRDGSVLNGFIQSQDGNGNLTVSTDSAIICISREVFNISESANSVSINGFVVNGKKDSATVEKKSRFWSCLKNKSFGNVHIMERGATIRFVELSPNRYEISWDDVLTIRADKRPQNVLSGIKRHYYLTSNREVEGEYAGETKETLSLFHASGMIETIKFADVQKFTLSAINPEQEIFEQSPLLDVVSTKDHREFRGIIIEHNYASSKDENNYISIWEQGKSPQMVRISEIVSIGKEENGAYAPKYDVILKDGEVLVNRMPTINVKVKEYGDMLVVDSLSQKLDTLSTKVVLDRTANAMTAIVVEYKTPANSNVEAYQFVKLSKRQMEKKLIKYVFTYKELANSIRPNRNIETSVNKTAKVQYAVNAAGVYVLYDGKKHVAIPVIIK